MTVDYEDDSLDSHPVCAVKDCQMRSCAGHRRTYHRTDGQHRMEHQRTGAASVEVEERKTMDTAATLGPDMVTLESVQQVVDRDVVRGCEPSSTE